MGMWIAIKIVNAIHLILTLLGWYVIKTLLFWVGRQIRRGYFWVENKLYHIETFRYWWYRLEVELVCDYILDIEFYAFILFFILYTIYKIIRGILRVLRLNWWGGIVMVFDSIIFLCSDPNGQVFYFTVFYIFFLWFAVVCKNFFDKYFSNYFWDFWNWLYWSSELQPLILRNVFLIIRVCFEAPILWYGFVTYVAAICWMFWQPWIGIEFGVPWLAMPPLWLLGIACDEDELDWLLNRGCWVSKYHEWPAHSYDTKYLHSHHYALTCYKRGFSVRRIISQFPMAKKIRYTYFYLFNGISLLFFDYRDIYFRIPVEEFVVTFPILHDVAKCKVGPFYFAKYARGLHDVYFVRHRPIYEWFHAPEGNEFLGYAALCWWIFWVGAFFLLETYIVLERSYGLSWIFPWEDPADYGATRAR
jgi:hypothetical protein